MPHTEFQQITNIPEIRVVVATSPGFGHLRSALTVMQKLRFLGFQGTFDVRYNEIYQDQLFDDYTLVVGETGKKLKAMFPNYVPDPIDDSDIPKIITSPNLGTVKITRIPKINATFTHTSITFFPGNEMVLPSHNDQDLDVLDQLNRDIQKFNSDYFISLQPTDWHNSRFVAYEDKLYLIDKKMRLSSPIEKAPVQLFESMFKHGYFQLVYGLYQNTEKSYGAYLDAKTVVDRLVSTHKVISKEFGKPVFLLLPRPISNTSPYWRDGVTFLDLTKGDNFEPTEYLPGEVVIAYMGPLTSEIFDNLMLYGTNLPPVIEGRNAIESCEYNGRAYIHDSNANDNIIKLGVNLTETQELHSRASACLEIEPSYNCGSLYEYIKEFLKSDSLVQKYHQQRQQVLLEKGDSVECALQILDIEANYTDQYTNCHNAKLLGDNIT